MELPDTVRVEDFPLAANVPADHTYQALVGREEVDAATAQIGCVLQSQQTQRSDRNPPRRLPPALGTVLLLDETRGSSLLEQARDIGNPGLAEAHANPPPAATHPHRPLPPTAPPPR